jgi:hypothetical protein
MASAALVAVVHAVAHLHHLFGDPLLFGKVRHSPSALAA